MNSTHLKSRRFVVCGLFVIAASTLIFGAIRLQIDEPVDLAQRAESRSEKLQEIKTHRGIIFDRNNELLAVSVPHYLLQINPSQLLHAKENWADIAKVIDWPVIKLEKFIIERGVRKGVTLKRELSVQQVDIFRRLNISGVDLMPFQKRHYPLGAPVSQLVGFTDRDDSGQEGVEKAFNPILEGKAGKRKILQDAKGNTVKTLRTIGAVTPGEDLRLSIDSGVQYAAYRALEKAVIREDADGGSAVVMDPHNGEVLAIVSYPSFDPNKSNEKKPFLFRNRAVTDAFEPGSTLKPFTIAMALESGHFLPDTKIDTSPGYFYLGSDQVSDPVNRGLLSLSENPEFAEACSDAGIVFIGPSPEVMRKLGNKIQARVLAESSGVAVMPATNSLPGNEKEVAQLAEHVGYPLMLKASWGGGGRGMRVIEFAEDLHAIVQTGRREALAAFNNDEIYLEKLVKNARHVEVQILGDNHGNIVHLFERDCTVQRRNQKVVERAPAIYLTEDQRNDFCLAAIKVCKAVSYTCAGTVEFLQDVDTGAFYFIEVNPRIQVEHTVTESITGIDIVKAQIRISEGHSIGSPESGIPPQADIKIHGHAIQCRVTAEDPENNFIPDYGTITTYRSPAGFGVRLDAGTAYTGAEITRYYDSLLVKVTAWAATEEEVALRMRRALMEFRIRGISTNLAFLAGLMTNKKFQKAEYTTRFIDETPELMELPRRRDRGTKLLNYIAEVIAKGNPAVTGRPWPSVIEEPSIPCCEDVAIAPGSRQKFEELGATKFSKWILEQNQILVTDTTFRDAHQSLLATRFRSHDLLQICDAYARLAPQLLSVECWGGATFDVAMRFLNECPWTRLKSIREKLPNVLTQMLLRASNGVGYKNYPDNVVNYFINQAATSGVDIFRVFDSLNWVENMRLPIDFVIDSGKICEATICYTGNLVGASEKKYNLAYYVKMAKELEAAGAHILGIKDMAGLCLPRAATLLVSELKQEIGIPIHFHTHDTSGIAGATVLAAIDAGVDAVDLAMDSMSGMTSQPNMGSVLEALRNGPRESNLDGNAIRMLSDYWAGVRRNYSAFESQERTGASEVYVHGMPGGQFTNLREQARSLGLGRRWSEVAKAYAEVNEMFGDIVKVTPSSKVVGDMALMMVSSGLSRVDVESESTDVAFPESVVSFFRGDLGQPLGGFPAPLRAKVLQGEVGLEVRPGSVLAIADLDEERGIAEKRAARQISDEEFASYLMYPDVFIEYVAAYRKYSDLTVLPTTIFFYGMESGQEVQLQIESARSIVLRYMGMSEADQEGCQTVYFELNGQPRQVRVVTEKREKAKIAAPKSDAGNECHVGCPMPGLIAQIDVEEGDEVGKGQSLFTIEAMKMQTTIRAERDGTIKEIVVSEAQQVDSGDLLAVFD